MYVYVSEDYGQNWTNISSSISKAPVNVIREDSVNQNILYVGTDNGLYISFDRGINWQPFMNGLPPVAVHDLVIQTEAKDLVIGTHGRSIYKVSLKAIQQLNDTVLAQDLKIFDIQKMNYSENWGSNWSKWLAAYEPETTVDYYVKKAGIVQIQVLNDAGVVVFEDTQNAVSGINQWNYKVEASKSGVERWVKKDKKVVLKPAKNNKTYLIPGNYQVKLTQGTVSQQVTLEIAKDERK